jgi:hypothetical protein
MNGLVQRAGWGVAAVLALFVAAAFSGVVSGGPLDPPAPPAPTQPQVEPRTPISSLPYAISTSGSYFLTRSLSASSGSGITVSANDVTIDLMGFTLAGAPLTTSDGIASSGAVRNIAIKNGNVNDWGSNGINLLSAAVISIDGVRLTQNGSTGMDVGTNARVTNCSAVSYEAGVVAIRVSDSSVVSHCSTQGYGTGIATSANSTVEDCSVTLATATGIYLGDRSVVQRCSVSYIGTGGAGGNGIFAAGQESTVRDSAVRTVLGGLCCSFGIRSSGLRNNIVGNETFQAGTGIVLSENTSALVERNTNAGGDFAIVGFAGNDVGPVQLAAGTTSPSANHDRN